MVVLAPLVGSSMKLDETALLSPFRSEYCFRNDSFTPSLAVGNVRATVCDGYTLLNLVHSLDLLNLMNLLPEVARTLS